MSEEQTREYLEEMKRQADAGITKGTIHIGGEDEMRDFVDGLLSLATEDRAENEHHCPNCREVRVFEVLTLVPRPKFGVLFPVKGCPECPHTTVPVTEEMPIEEVTDG